MSRSTMGLALAVLALVGVGFVMYKLKDTLFPASA